MSTRQVRLFNELEPLKNLGAAVTNEKDTLSKNLIVIDGRAYINNADMTLFCETSIPFDIIVDYSRFVSVVQYIGDQDILLTYHEDGGTLKITDTTENIVQVMNVTKPDNTTVFFDYKDYTPEKISQIAEPIDGDDVLAEFLVYLKDTKGLGTLHEKSTNAFALTKTGSTTGEAESVPFSRGWHVGEFERQYYIVSSNINNAIGVGHPNTNQILGSLIGTGLSGRVTSAILKIETPLARVRINDTVMVLEYMDGTILVATKLRQISNDHDYLDKPILVKQGLRKMPEQEEYATLETGFTADDHLFGAIKLTMLGFTDEADLIASLHIDSQGIAHLTSANKSASAYFDTKLRNINPRRSEVVLNWLLPLIGQGDCIHFGIGVITIFKPKGCVILQVKPVTE